MTNYDGGIPGNVKKDLVERPTFDQLPTPEACAFVEEVVITTTNSMIEHVNRLVAEGDDDPLSTAHLLCAWPDLTDPEDMATVQYVTAEGAVRAVADTMIVLQALHGNRHRSIMMGATAMGMAVDAVDASGEPVEINDPRLDAELGQAPISENPKAFPLIQFSFVTTDPAVVDAGKYGFTSWTCVLRRGDTGSYSVAGWLSFEDEPWLIEPLDLHMKFGNAAGAMVSSVTAEDQLMTDVVWSIATNFVLTADPDDPTFRLQQALKVGLRLFPDSASAQESFKVAVGMWAMFFHLLHGPEMVPASWIEVGWSDKVMPSLAIDVIGPGDGMGFRTEDGWTDEGAYHAWCMVVTTHIATTLTGMGIPTEVSAVLGPMHDEFMNALPGDPSQWGFIVTE
jgi:hypothetical protein